MGQSTLSVRIDDDIKQIFDDFCTEVGLNPSVAVNMFVRAVIKEKRIPFEIAAAQDDPFYSKTNQMRLRRAMKQLEEGRGVERDLIEVDDEENLV